MDALPQHAEGALLTGLTGSVVQMVGLTASVADFPAPVGALVDIHRDTGGVVEGEVVGFRENQTLVMPLQNAGGVRRGSPVKLVRTSRTLKVGDELLGRVVDGRGRCIDGRPQPMLRTRRTLTPEAVPATERPPIDAALPTGVKAIDAMLTCGRGQRIGVFAGSGVGKSVLMGMMSRRTAADVSVIALIGERSREVNEFIQRELGPEGLAKSVVVVATSDQPALIRTQAALTATTIAEHFRDQGQDVLLVMDSLTRYALAQREIGLSAGEPPTTRGYTPSVFAELPKLVERAGRTDRGSITAFYSVLVEGDDENEPIADAVRGLLDGHVWLSRKIAERAQYPAIDVLPSISRLMNTVADDRHRASAELLRRLMATLRDHEDLVSIGAYRKGSNPELDVALEARPQIDQLLAQRPEESHDFAAVLGDVQKLAQACAAKLGATQNPKAEG
ncbi:MAG: FliI/YscN family ATPase [Planctomycetota bacterium]